MGTEVLREEGAGEQIRIKGVGSVFILISFDIDELIKIYVVFFFREKCVCGYLECFSVSRYPSRCACISLCGRRPVLLLIK